jgi:hypothetical protein
MTITVIRRALWAVAVVALGSATVAFWYWLPVQLIVSTGLFVVLIPIDMLLHREEIERRQSPFGPVRKFGISEDAVRGYGTGWETGYGSRSIVASRKPWWRRMYRRITAPWWVAAWMPLLLIPAGLWLAPIVHAGPLEDAAYISVLDDFGVYYSSEQAAIDTAYSICAAFDAGASFRRVLHAALAAGFTQTDAASEIGAAIGIYCIEHADLLQPRTVIA